jgi:hypothetical protein
MPPSANQFTNTQWVAMEALRLLTNPLEIAPYFNTDYNSELTKEFPVGTSFQVPFPKQFIASNSLAYTPQPIIDRLTTVTVDQVSSVHFDYDSIEAALKMPRGRERISDLILKPAMATIRQDIDLRCSRYAYLNTPNIVGVLGTNPTTFDAVYGAAGQRMQELGAWTGDKAAFLSPSVTRALRASAVSQFNPVEDVSKMFRKGIIGEANGFDTYASMSLFPHTAGTWAGVVEVLAAGQSGATLSLTATTGDTFNPGDVFHIAGVFEVNPMTRLSTGTLKQFTVGGVVPIVAAANAATVPIIPAIIGPGSPYQNVSALPAAGADLTLFPGTASPNGKSGTQNLLMGRNAFALVAVRLQNPTEGSVEMVSQARDPRTGVSVAFVRAFDAILRRWINRFDTLYGFGPFYNDRAAVRLVAA